MIKIQELSMFLMCIGKTNDGIVDVVYLFDINNETIEMLKKYDPNLSFKPMLHLKKKSDNKFTNDYNDPKYRFDVGSSSKECNRLLEKICSIVRNCSNKRTIEYLNEDLSQIQSETHQREQQSINMSREACRTVGSIVERFIEDNYTSTDFRINKNIRVQDKVLSSIYLMKHKGRYPYNPDKVDILQITEIDTKIVYAIPMRKKNKKNEIVSTFTEEQLMKSSVRPSEDWKNRYSIYKYNLNKDEEIRKYVKSCEDAYNTPELTDRKFYENIIEKNKDKFGSKKQLKELENKS